MDERFIGSDDQRVREPVMNRRDFIKRGALFVPFAPAIIRPAHAFQLLSPAAAAPSSPWTFIVGTSQAGNSGGVSSSPAIDTTGVDFIVGAAGYGGAGTWADLVGGNSNSWSSAVLSATGTNGEKAQLFWTRPTHVGSGHVFGFNGSNCFGSIAVACYSGSAVSPLDQTNSAAGPTPGSITPTKANELIATALAMGAAGTPTISGGGFSSPRYVVPFVNGTNYGVALADIFQSSAAASNPSWAGLTDVASVIASFESP
jgi:hypothetical protein